MCVSPQCAYIDSDQVSTSQSDQQVHRDYVVSLGGSV